MNQNIVWESCRNIRALARVALRGKWKIAAVATAIYFVALMVPAAILNMLFYGKANAEVLSNLYTFLVTAPFTVGYTIFCINLFRGNALEIAQIFYGFERFFKAMGLYLLMCLFILLWTILFIVPGIIAAYRYSQAFLVMVDYPEYSPMECLAESKRIMKGNKMKFFLLSLSFIGWAILAAIPMMIVVTPTALNAPQWSDLVTLIGSIPYFWLTPYLTVAGVAFYEMASGRLKPEVIDVQGSEIHRGDFVPQQVESSEYSGQSFAEGERSE
ncbi:DUF975 family protein [Aminipila butyrica]|uniref:DUF975 family protein n=1 Tax=Aminipila butyrica TaxID=433296 RepID=A0A858BT20_9FIRM|nr:DUF975 family protein [Aminipila butyrica]QIB69063.1 DUF975 family protein [Aminipila butyrica]